jgi:hypothetical protein
LGQNSILFQEHIVDRFPNELQKGSEDEGVPKSLAASENVLIGLGLSKSPELASSREADYSDMPIFVQSRVGEISRMIIGTQKPTKHCILVRNIVDGGIIVMDPSEDDFSFLSWNEFMAKEPDVMLLGEI